MFQVTVQKEEDALGFIQQVKDGNFSVIREECLEFDRMPLAEEEPEPIYYYSYA